MFRVESRRMCLVPDVVPPLAGLRFIPSYAFSTMFSLWLLCKFFKTAHCFWSLYHSWDHFPRFYNSVREEISPPLIHLSFVLFVLRSLNLICKFFLSASFTGICCYILYKATCFHTRLFFRKPSCYYLFCKLKKRICFECGNQTCKYLTLLKSKIYVKDGENFAVEVWTSQLRPIRRWGGGGGVVPTRITLYSYVSIAHIMGGVRNPMLPSAPYCTLFSPLPFPFPNSGACFPPPPLSGYGRSRLCFLRPVLTYTRALFKLLGGCGWEFYFPTLPRSCHNWRVSCSSADLPHLPSSSLTYSASCSRGFLCGETWISSRQKSHATVSSILYPFFPPTLSLPK